MKKSGFTEEQIAYALRQAEAGTPLDDVCRQLGMSSVGGDLLRVEEEICARRDRRALPDEVRMPTQLRNSSYELTR
jgi:hypothetical protein